jgi:hypothetical protein
MRNESYNTVAVTSLAPKNLGMPIPPPRRPPVLLLSCLVVAISAENRCRCLDSIEAYSIDTSAGLVVNTTQGGFTYPSTYGSGSCAAHDRDLSPFCDVATPPEWCYHTWCYVNASECEGAAVATSFYLSEHERGDEVFFSYEACGASDAFTAWYAAATGTIKLCSVFAEHTPGGRPCGNTASHLQVEAMVDLVNSLSARPGEAQGLGFQVLANTPSFPSYYRFSYEYLVYPKDQWESVGRNLSDTLFPQCDVIVGQGHGCSDAEIREQARVAASHQRLYFTLRGPRAVLADDMMATQDTDPRLSPYFFSTHIRSDFYAHPALSKMAIKAAGSQSSVSQMAPISIAVLNWNHNAFFDGVATEALNYAAAPGSGYRVVFNATLKGAVCANYDAVASTDGVCKPLSRYLDELLAAAPQALVVSSLAPEFAHTIEYLSRARHSVSDGDPQDLAAEGKSHVLSAIWWTGVPWKAAGEWNCKGFEEHCSYAIGATQISEYEADAFEDELLRENGVPSTYDWLKGNHSALKAAYDDWVLKAEADAAVVPSIVAQAMQDVFRYRTPADRAKPLRAQGSADYETLRARLASGDVVAKTFYGDIAFDAFGSNAGRTPTTFQTNDLGVAQIVIPEHLPESRELVYPAPAYSSATLGVGAYTIDFGGVCNSTGWWEARAGEVGNGCTGACNEDDFPCGVEGGGQTSCLLCAPIEYAPLPPAEPITLEIVVAAASTVGVLLISLVYVAVRLRRKQAEVLRSRTKEVMKAMRLSTELTHSAALVPAPAFVALGRLESYETLRDRSTLRYCDTLSSLRGFASSEGGVIVFISHQWTATLTPDPTGAQYRTMVAGIQSLAKKNGWQLSNVYVWCDYCSIPQANKSQQMQAINALPCYASHAHAFLVAAPSLPHVDTQKPLDTETYRGRVWCRAEQLCFAMTNGAQDMYVAVHDGVGAPDAGGPDLDLVQLTGDSDWLFDAMHVFEGEATFDSDKLNLVTPVLGLYAQLLAMQPEWLERRRRARSPAAPPDSSVSSTSTAGGKAASERAPSNGAPQQGSDAVSSGMLALIRRDQQGVFPRVVKIAERPTGEKAKGRDAMTKNKQVELFGRLVERLEEIFASDDHGDPEVEATLDELARLTSERHTSMQAVSRLSVKL